jgi:site-specific DNA-methyltransferase (adenine-specific)
LKPYYQDSAVTIYHADCRDILPQLEPVNLVLTDPPYGIGYGKYESHIDDAEKYPEMIWSVLSECEKRVFDGWVGTFQAAKTAPMWASWIPRQWRLISMPKTFVQILPTKGPTWATDYVLVWSVGNPKQKAVGRDWFVCETSDMSKRPDGHPCPRPLNGIKFLVSILSEPYQIILDPFMGSGTTLRATKDLGRKAIGIEIEEKYCEIAAKRMSQEVLEFERTNEKRIEETPSLFATSGNFAT